MIWLAKLLPFQYYAIGAIVLALGGSLGAQTWRLHSSEAKTAEAQSTLEQERAAGMRAALTATTANRAEEQRRTTAQQEIVNDAITKTAVVAADAAAARDSHDRLLDRYTALAASRGPAPVHPAAAQGSAPASGPGLVLTDVFRRLDDRAGLLATLADQRWIAGSACEKAYDALTR